MIAFDPAAVARDAVAAQSSRPATSMLLVTPDARIVVFRIAPQQVVPPHLLAVITPRPGSRSGTSSAAVEAAR